MAKNRNRRRPPVARPSLSLTVLGDDMRRHVAALGFADLAVYLAWCRHHGLPGGITKSSQQRRCEQELVSRLGADVRLRERVRLRNPVEAVRRVLAGEELPDERYREVAAVLRDTAVPRAQQQLLAAVLQRLAVTMPETLEPGGAGLRVAMRIATHHAAVVRSVDDWSPRSHNEAHSLLALVQHVFARYPAPACLLDAWLATDEASALHRRWYLHVVAGNNLRKATGLPIELTKRMAHAFEHAPVRLSVNEALRYAQVRGLGGSARLALTLAGTHLGRDFANDDFWRTFVLFCSRHSVDDAGRVVAMVDFLHEHRHVVRLVVDVDGRQVEVPPAQPHLAMHGRTPESLQKQVDAWHRRLGRGAGTEPRARWLPSDVPGYRSVADEGAADQCVWTVHELCSAIELRHESVVMRHCVVGYAGRCARGDIRIFTLTRAHGDVVRSIATFEVRDRKIVQARGYANAALKPAAKEHMQRWAAGAGLTITAWVE
jgi:hypothetical protein